MNLFFLNRISLFLLIVLLVGAGPGFTQESGTAEFTLNELQAQTDFSTSESWKLADDGSIFIASEGSNRISMFDGNRKRIFSFKFPFATPIGNFSVSDDGSVFGLLSERDTSKPRFCQPFFADKTGLVLSPKKLAGEFCFLEIFDTGALVTIYSGGSSRRKAYYAFSRKGEVRRIVRTPSKYSGLYLQIWKDRLVVKGYTGDCTEEGVCFGDTFIASPNSSYKLKRAKYLDGYRLITSAGGLSIFADKEGNYYYSTGSGKNFSLSPINELGNALTAGGIHPNDLNADGTVLALQVIQDSFNNVPYLYDRVKGLRALFDIAPIPGNLTGINSIFQINRRGQILVEVIEGFDLFNSKVYLLSPVEIGK